MMRIRRIVAGLEDDGITSGETGEGLDMAVS